ncbi:MAG: NUDIX domain-containing protein [Elusimicrobia bacterium]|nr:NUDIX domain-containing protein [Elusimicrobiota bacterium]
MKEFAAGGITIRNKNVLIVKVINLQDKVVWTFPKGRIEKGETTKTTALREVEEETGYACKIIKPIGNVKYDFMRQHKIINKKVKWFLMTPLKKTGQHDSEILLIRWININKVKKYLTYPTDLKVLEKVARELK